MKYRRKPEIIEAEVYREGMEDGFTAVGDYGVEPMPKEEIGSRDWEGYTILKPFVWTTGGYRPICDGDYILTYPDGTKSVKSAKEFHEEYEAVVRCEK